MTIAKYRHNLPQSTGQILLTDGGMETELIFHQGFDLPYFASFQLLKTKQGRKAIKDYFRRYLRIARRNRTGFLLDTPTWRANRDWGALMGYDRAGLQAVNRDAVALMQEIREEHEISAMPIVISGVIGPRGDGYRTTILMSAEEAESYHRDQVAVFAEAGADIASAMTINYVEEAVGIVRACQKHHLPVVISFTLETDGALPSGQSLKGAIEQVDRLTQEGPAYYMINCAHPTHFEDVLVRESAWVGRIQGVRANASCLSHAELDEAEELDEGDPAELGRQFRRLAEQIPNLTVLGGCCGTDHRHIEAIAEACETSLVA